MSVRAWVGPDRRQRVGVLVRVSGVPLGQRAQLRATGTGSFHVHGGRCQRADGGYTCSATPGRRNFYFHVVTTSAARITFSVAAPVGYTDPATGNNSTTVTVPQTRGGNPSGQPAGNPRGAPGQQQRNAGRQPGGLPARRPPVPGWLSDS